ncbi:MAG: TolB family protein [Gemmatimonadales bacterium]
MAYALAACGGGDGTTQPGQPGLEVTASTTGDNLDPDGYVVIFDAQIPGEPVATNGTVVFNDLTPGLHSLQLTGLAPNCVTDTLRDVTIPSEGTAQATFNVTCVGPKPFDIAFTEQNQSASDIYRINAGGTGLTQLTHDGLSRYPAWSPDGTKIAFEHFKNPQPDIYVMNADGSDPHLLIADAFEPAWSADGTRLAFVHLTFGIQTLAHVMIAGSDGSNPVEVMNVEAMTAQPAWSPDGTTLAITPRGSILAPLELVAAQAGAQPTPLNVDQGVPRAPSWLPDGSALAFTFGLYGRDNADIYLINPDGSGLVPFSATGLNEFDPSWSPDGSNLAMIMGVPGTFESDLYVQSRDASTARRLTTDTNLKGRPTWGPAQ